MATQSKFYADLGIKSLTHTEIDGNLTIGGNLTVSGTQTIIDSTTSSVVDSMMELASGNTSADLIDIGFWDSFWGNKQNKERENENRLKNPICIITKRKK